MHRRTTIRFATAATIIALWATPARADFAADSSDVYGTWKLIGFAGGLVDGRYDIGDQVTTLSIFPNSRFYFRWAQGVTVRSLSHGNVSIRRSSQQMGDGPPARMEVKFTKGKMMMYFDCILATYRNADELRIYPGGCGGIVYDASIMIFRRVRRLAAPSDSITLYDFPEAPMQRPPAHPETLRFDR